MSWIALTRSGRSFHSASQVSGQSSSKRLATAETLSPGNEILILRAGRASLGEIVIGPAFLPLRADRRHSRDSRSVATQSISTKTDGEPRSHPTTARAGGSLGKYVR